MSAVRTYHAVLDIFAIPRTNDRVCQMVTPLKPVEAMASGLPVVVSDVHALGEIIKDDVTGLRFPPGDAAALADRLLRQRQPHITQPDDDDVHETSLLEKPMTIHRMRSAVHIAPRRAYASR